MLKRVITILIVSFMFMNVHGNVVADDGATNIAYSTTVFFSHLSLMAGYFRKILWQLTAKGGSMIYR